MGIKEQKQITELQKKIRALKRELRLSKTDLPKEKRAGASEKPDAMFQALINAFPDTALLIDESGTLRAYNKNVARHLPPDHKEKTFSIFEIFPHFNSPSWKTEFERVKREQRPYRIERMIEGRHFDHCVFPVIDGEGKVCFFAIFIQDITDYRLTEDALKSSENQYKNLVENISDTIYAANEEGIIIYVNRAVEPLLGYTPEEAKGRSFQEFLHPDEVPLVMSEFEGFLAGNIKQKEYRFRHKNGSLRWGRVLSHPVTFQETVIGYQGVISDITQAKTFNLNLVISAQESILKNLAIYVTAEIDPVLARARKALESFSDVTKGAALPERFSRLETDLQRISLFLKNLETFYQRTQGHESVGIQTLVNVALALFRVQFARENIELQCQFGDHLEPVRGPALSVVQVFINLFDYSLQALATEKVHVKTIGISVHMEKESVVILFTDNGKGISQEALAHLSDPFYAHEGGGEIERGLLAAINLVENMSGAFHILPQVEPHGLRLRIALPAVVPTL